MILSGQQAQPIVFYFPVWAQPLVAGQGDKIYSVVSHKPLKTPK